MLKSASTRNHPCETCNIASSARSLNCMGPGTASKVAPEASDGCLLSKSPRRFRIRRRNQ
eukprot:12953088-Alexandrium_andersonii.AAC.1